MRRLLTRWPPRFLRTPEAARVVGLSGHWRSTGRTGLGRDIENSEAGLVMTWQISKRGRMSALENRPRILDPERYCQPRKFSLRGALARTRLLVRVASQQQLRLADRVLTLQHEARIT